jgi:hypothetical protein
MNIKETVDKYKSVALVCSTFEDIRILLNEFKKDDIRQTYYFYREKWQNMFKKYTKHISPDHQSIIIIVKDKTGYKIYPRSYKDWGKYHDWINYHFINYSAFIREGKLNQLM